MNVIEILIYPGFAFLVFVSMIFFGIMRKLAARMQNRIGPPIWQPVLDFIKLIGKENINAEQVKAGFTLWPLVAITSILIAGLLTPIAGIAPLHFAGDIIVLIYFLILSSVAIYLSGFSSANPFGVVGSIRGLILLFAYELPFIMALVVPILALNTLSPLFVNSWQVQHTWIVLKFPLAAVVFFISLLGKIELPPFHIPAAKQEIVAGYFTEYTGFRLALIELAHAIKTFVLIALAIALFFGGSTTLHIFLVKSLMLLFLLTLIRVVMTRIRIDQALRFYWLLAGLALIDLIRVLL
jgi:NADH-quinone oxidoreductase subunit H